VGAGFAWASEGLEEVGGVRGEEGGVGREGDTMLEGCRGMEAARRSEFNLSNTGERRWVLEIDEMLTSMESLEVCN
jgi:hypothetical protein